MKMKPLIFFFLGVTLFPFDSPAQSSSPSEDSPKTEAEKAFLAVESELLRIWQSRLIRAGRSPKAQYAVHLGQGREMINRWGAYLAKYGDSAFAFRAKSYLVQGYMLKEEKKAAESLLLKMEKEAGTAPDILRVAMGFRHLRNDPRAGMEVLERFIAKTEDIEIKAGAMLEKRTFASGKHAAQIRARQVEISRKVAQMYPGTRAGKKAALLVRAAELAPGKRPLNMARFKDIEGKPIDLGAYKGKVLLIYFWATWSPACTQGLSDLARTYQAYHDQGLEILSINFDADRNQFLSAIKEKGSKWRHYFDGLKQNNNIGKLYDLDSIPKTILIGKDGRIAAMNPSTGSLPDRVRELVKASK